MRRQVGPLLIAALFGAAGTAAGLQPAANPATTTVTRPGTAVPTLPRIPPAFDPPASVHEQASSRRPMERQVMSTATAGSAELPPARALEAYQRAATVMGRAEPSCGLSWPLIAAIGGIESDHGRVGGTALGPDGVAHPALLGPPLDGGGSTARIVDTDHGSLDGDPAVDRALGPLQMIPSTWAVVAVDGDGDGIRDPQDIDDASLAAAVYLCAWHDDLGTDPGRRAAVFRYNRSSSYVDQVLATMEEYASAEASDVVTVLSTAINPPSSGEVVTAAEPAGPLGANPFWSPPGHAVWTVPPTTEWVAGPTPAPPAPAPTSAASPTAAPTAAPPTVTPAPTPPAAPPTDTPPVTPGSSASSAPDPLSATEAATTPTAPATDQPTTGPSDPSPATPGAPPLPGSAPGSPGRLPADLSPPEAEAWTTCVTGSDSVADVTLLADCLASALGLPEDDPRLVWLVAQVPGREKE